MGLPKEIIDDYTLFPPKTKVGNGKTDKCPICGEVALVEDLGDKIGYLHRLWQGSSEDGNLVIGEDSHIIKAPQST